MADNLAGDLARRIRAEVESKIQQYLNNLTSNPQELMQQAMGEFMSDTMGDIGPWLSKFMSSGATSPSQGPGHSQGAAVSPKESSPKWELFIGSRELLVVVELPGLNSGDLQVTATPYHLTVAGKKNRPFRLDIPLPAPVKSREGRVTYKGGLLLIGLPKDASAQPQPLDIIFRD